MLPRSIPTMSMEMPRRRQLLLEEGDRALADRRVLLHQHRESHRRSRRVFELTVAVLVGQSGRREQPPRAGGVVRIGRHVGRIPRTEARRHRAEDRHRGAEVDRVGDGLAIDAEGQGLPELRCGAATACDPSAAAGFRLNQRTFGSRPIAGVEQLQPSLIGEALEARVVVRAGCRRSTSDRSRRTRGGAPRRSDRG